MILFRTEAGNDVGSAHLTRCLLMAQALRDKNIACSFLVAASDAAQSERVRQAGFSVIEMPQADLYGNEVGRYPRCDAVVVDLQHTRSIANPDLLVRLLKSQKERGVKTIFLDAMYDEAFRHPDAPRLYAYVQPYVGAEQDSRPDCEHWLAGAQYAMMAPAYANRPPKQIVKTAKNLLVTFGGADPQGITLRVLKDIAGSQLNVRVIEGPYFREEHKRQIRQSAADVISAPPSLELHYEWADIAIGSSGLSRYEFAAMGLPSVYCAIYPYHIRACEVFAQSGTAKYVGYYKDIGEGIWRIAVEELAQDSEARRTMCIKGQALIDGGGIERLINKLISA